MRDRTDAIEAAEQQPVKSTTTSLKKFVANKKIGGGKIGKK
jgi:hypothetical protein